MNVGGGPSGVIVLERSADVEKSGDFPSTAQIAKLQRLYVVVSCGRLELDVCKRRWEGN